MRLGVFAPLIQNQKLFEYAQVNNQAIAHFPLQLL